MTGARHRRPAGPLRALAIRAAICAGGAIIGPSLALVQALPPGGDILPEISLRGQGWSQALNMRELTEFLLALVEMTVLTAALVLHPVNRTALQTHDNFRMMHQKFLFGLIGMIVGFLVMHHGYLIGFVIFGLGGLMRFRTEADDTSDTTRIIVVSLVRLCVGLDLPVMALIATVSAWLVICIFGDRARCYLAVRFDEMKFAPGDIEALAETLKAQGFAPLATSRARFKATAEYMLRSDARNWQMIDRIMTEFREAKHSSVRDWHLE